MQKTTFTYTIIWSEEDGEYVGLCDQFPSLSWLSESQEEALAGIMRLVRDCIKDQQESI